MNKEPKKVKPPSAFKKPIKKKVVETRYFKHLEHPQDKKFFVECFVKKDDEYVVIRDNLTKEDVKRLKSLLGVIKANRKGAVKVVPLLFASAIVGAVVVFFMIFANPILSSALEKGLEAIFEAKADVKGFRLSLVPMEFRISSITVANRDAPMTNLFELGKTRISIKTAALLRGKVYIEEIRADTIRFGTARTVSGAIPLKPPKEKPVKEKTESPPLVDLKNFDAMALLNQEFDKLLTPKFYDQAIAAYDETVTKWQGQIESSRGTVTELQTASAPVLAINVNNLRDVETIRTAIQDVTTMVNTAQKAADEATKLLNSVESDLNMARALEQNARNSITDDINYLKSFVDLGSGTAFAALEPFIEEVLSDSAQVYLDYGLRALEALEKIKALSDAQPPKQPKPKKEKKVVFKGRDVIYPVVHYPAFYLGVLASDFKLPNDPWKWAFDLRNISSDPQWSLKNTGSSAVTLALDVNEENASLSRYVGFKGSADFRNDTQERFNALVNAGGFPLSLGDQLSGVGINGFTGESALSVNMSGQPSGAFTGGGGVMITQAALIDPRGTIAEAVDTAVKNADHIKLDFQYFHHIDKKDEFKIDTNIAELIAQALRQIAEVYARQAMAEIERALRQKIDEYIEDKFGSKADLDQLVNIARGDKAAIDQVRNSLNSKKDEFEQRLKSMVDEAAAQATQQIRDQATQQIQNVAPSLPTPSLPSSPFSR